MEKEETKMQFKALTEGLGFHPFSNGLPYAPVTPKSDLSKGTGAYSAGRPTFITPQKAPQLSRAPQVYVPIATRATPARSAGIARQVPEAVVPHFQIEANLGYEYVIKRCLAYFLDSFLNVTIGAAALALSLWSQGSNLDFIINPSVVLVSGLFLLFLNWALITAQEVVFHTSLGKKFFGLQLKGSVGTILLRAIFFIPSSLMLGIGTLWALVDPHRRCWHDIASGMQPQEIAEL